MERIKHFPSLSVIIPTYNRKDSLIRLLLSLAEQSCPYELYEVVIADDGSTDGTEEAVADFVAPYKLWYSWQENAGVNAARNRGLHQAYGDIVLFLDDDMVADPRLLEEHLKAHERYPKAIFRGQVFLACEHPPDVYAALRANQPEVALPNGSGIQEISY